MIPTQADDSSQKSITPIDMRRADQYCLATVKHVHPAGIFPCFLLQIDPTPLRTTYVVGDMKTVERAGRADGQMDVKETCRSDLLYKQLMLLSDTAGIEMKLRNQSVRWPVSMIFLML